MVMSSREMTYLGRSAPSGLTGRNVRAIILSPVNDATAGEKEIYRKRFRVLSVLVPISHTCRVTKSGKLTYRKIEGICLQQGTDIFC